MLLILFIFVHSRRAKRKRKKKYQNFKKKNFYAYCSADFFKSIVINYWNLQ